MFESIIGCFASAPKKEEEPTLSELLLECSDGMEIAAQMWQLPAKGNGRIYRILCLHGWLDNCRSFYHLAPELILSMRSKPSDDNKNGKSEDVDGVEVVALDLPGHGLSSHKSADGPCMIRADFLIHIAEALKELNWWTYNADPDSQIPIIFIGHSMGAAIATMYAAAFPEQVEKVVMLDSLGHLDYKFVADTPKTMRAYIENHLNEPNALHDDNRFYYKTMDQAFEARTTAPARYFPGKQYISDETARELVSRGVEEIPSKGFRYRHDPRLKWGIIQYLTTDQVHAIWSAIECPVCVFLAEEGWPYQDAPLEVAQQVLQPKILSKLPGSHHMHADPKTADRVVKEVTSFLLKVYSSES